MHCTHCQQELTKASAFCPHCGAAMDGDAWGQQSAPPPPGLGSSHIKITAQEMADYAGPKDEFYLPYFALYERQHGRFSSSWNWSAFLGCFWWFLYRKMYLWAGVVFLLGGTGLGPWAIWVPIPAGVLGNWLYYREARSQVVDVKRLYKSEDQGTVIIERGGVHRWAAWLGLGLGAFSLLLIIVLLAA